MASELIVDGVTLKDNYGHPVILSVDDMKGHILQTVSKASNESYGTKAFATPWAVEAIDLNLITKSDNSEFYVSAQVLSDDTNSAAFGVGMGSQFSLDGVNWTYWAYPAAHEDYHSAAGDSYRIISMRRMTKGEIQVPKGTVLYFRIMCRFNNSNGQWYGGTEQPHNSLEHIVQEIKA